MQQKRRAQPAIFTRQKGGAKQAARIGAYVPPASCTPESAAPASSGAPLGPKGLPGPGAPGRPLARWWQMWYDKRQKGAAQCLCRSTKGGARRNAAPAENRGLLYGTI